MHKCVHDAQLSWLSFPNPWHFKQWSPTGNFEYQKLDFLNFDEYLCTDLSLKWLFLWSRSQNSGLGSAQSTQASVPFKYNLFLFNLFVICVASPNTPLFFFVCSCSWSWYQATFKTFVNLIFKLRCFSYVCAHLHVTHLNVFMNVASWNTGINV